MGQEHIPAGSIDGEVTSFVAAKGFGFIRGSDGESYFAHMKDVIGGEPLVTGQQVTFVPTPAPKGSKAKHIMPGQAPTLIYQNPDDFVWSKGGPPRGMEVVLITGNGWARSNDPNEERSLLKGQAREYGANAVLNASMTRYTDSAACSNYRFTMHQVTAQFAVLKVVVSTSDPALIAQSQHEMQMLTDWWAERNSPQAQAAQEPAGETRLVEPEQVKLVLGIAWSWTITILKILGLTAIYFWRKASKLINARLAASSKKGQKKAGPSLDDDPT